MTILQEEEVSNVTKGFVIQFTPTLVNTRTPNPAWNGNMPLSSLESFPILSVIGETSTMVCIKNFL